MRAQQALGITIFFVGLVHAQPSAPASAGTALVDGIPVTDPLVISKCSSCHVKDSQGNLSRISWIRTTPEGWQEAVKRMVRLNGLALTPEEARLIVKSLSATHGLAPEEARPVMYMPEHRIIDEQYASPTIREACASCHALGRPASWRRSKEEWQLLVNMHIGYFPNAEGSAFRRPPGRGGAAPNGATGGAPAPPPPQPVDAALDFLSKTYPLRTPEWAAWRARMRTPRLAGKWLVAAHYAGHGNYIGEMTIAAGEKEDEFTSNIRLTPVSGGPALERTGRGLVYAGYSWRGRSSGSGSPDPGAIPAEMHETMWISPEGTQANGRWFWGAYDEFGFDVKLTRASDGPILLSTDRLALKAGSQSQQVRVLGDNLPARVSPADLDFGAGLTVRRIVSNSARELVAEVDVAQNAISGKRDIVLGRTVLPSAIAIYDRIDYIKIVPDTGMARLGGASQRQKGYQQFEVMAYNRGIDNKPNTDDDVELGPIDVAWSVEEFFERFDDDDKLFVGSLNPSTGLFTPNIDGPNPERKQSGNNYGNVWVVATAKNEKDRLGKPLVGKAYLVVAPPLYIIWDQEIDR
ncbi:MAG: quinohemoprotein amine dehydrogenase subunit alpha [Acidobacteriia bacterium]|nr:quinohemoprotein amine dehydrogenase subunit alpha [Terriglobia bacterium]